MATWVKRTNLSGPKGNSVENPRIVADQLIIDEKISGVVTSKSLGVVKGDPGEDGAPGLPGAESVPTGEAIAQHLTLAGDARDAADTRVAEIVTGLVAGPTLAPVYIDTRLTGLEPTTPANLRTGLPTTTYAGQGFTHELSLTVTGSKGSKVLTSPDSAKVAGLGANPFAAVLNAADGGDDFFATVVSHNGTNQVTLRRPLDADFTGTLSSKYDADLGQHLTKAATRAYAQHAARYNGALGARGGILAGCWSQRPATFFTDVWVRNAALATYGTLNTADSPIVRTDMTVSGNRNVVHAADKLAMFATAVDGGPRVGTHKQGHGMTATLRTGRRDATLEFFTAAQRSTNSALTYLLRVVVTGDGVVIYDQQHDAFINRVLLPVAGFDEVVIEVTNDNVTDTPYSIFVHDLTVREAGTSGRVGTGRVVTFGDSWFNFYDGEFAKALATKTGATVVNHALGGMTTEWALAWFDEYVLAEKPDEAWFHFFTNDANNLTGTFTAPDGTQKPLWPTGLTNDQSIARWRRNINLLIARCQSAGIRPVVFAPGGVASESQMQNHMRYQAKLEQPRLTDWAAQTAELASATAYVNTVGKRAGWPVFNATTGKPLVAAGGLATSPWNDATGAVAHTPA